MKRFVVPSKEVIEGQKLSRSLEAAASEIAEEAGRGLDAALAGYLAEGETPPSPEADRHRLLARWLRQTRERLVAADEAHQASIRDERLIRREREDIAKLIRSKIAAVRGSVETVYGVGLASLTVRIAEDIPEDPVVLHRYAARIIEEVKDSTLELPEPKVKGGALQPARLLKDLEEPMTRLEEIFERLEPQRRRRSLLWPRNAERTPLSISPTAASRAT